MNDEFFFLGERISQPNPETDFFLLNSDPTFIQPIEADDLESDRILLRFSQRIWELPTESYQFLIPYYSKYYQEFNDPTPFHVHDIFYQEYLKEKIPLEKSTLHLPTLSFRTLILDSLNHIKFGLPIRYGRFLRDNPKFEVLAVLYLSDYIYQLPKIALLDFFTEFKGYSFPAIESFSVSYRKLAANSSLMPVSCYLNQILNHAKGSAKERFEHTLSFVENITKDFDLIFKQIQAYGLGLEVHGQNLMVKVDSDGVAQRKYYYRDLGNCSIDPKIHASQADLNHYYQSEYDFELPKKFLRKPHYRAWMSFRIFFLGFLIYNLNQFAQKEKINLDVYEWFDKLVNELPEMKKIY